MTTDTKKKKLLLFNFVPLIVYYYCYCCYLNDVLVNSFQQKLLHIVPRFTKTTIRVSTKQQTFLSARKQSSTFLITSQQKQQQRAIFTKSTILYASRKEEEKQQIQLLDDIVVDDDDDDVETTISNNQLILERFQKAYDIENNNNNNSNRLNIKDNNFLNAGVLSTAVISFVTSATSAIADASTIVETASGTSGNNNFLFTGISQGNLNPATFQPVCGASDNFYRLLQQTTLAIVGKDSFIEYGPLIAGGLLRIRLELCVVESFFNEAVGPFIQQNGIAWILPLHETVETFLAGGIFAIATTFILVGSTKLLTVVATYTDFIFGFPSRFIGGFIFDRAIGKPVTLDLNLGPWFKPRLFGPPKIKNSNGQEIDEVTTKEYKIETNSLTTFVVLALFGIIKFFGETLKFIRELLEGFDYFVGRYLVLGASFYVLIKFLHFKVFPDFP